MASELRPELVGSESASGYYKPAGGTAYLMIYNAVKSKDKLIHGRMHANGESCALGSYWDVNKKCTLGWDVINEIAAVNDSVPNATPKQRRAYVLRWLGWKLAQVGMPGFYAKKRKK